jgi:hypothetical protein
MHHHVIVSFGKDKEVEFKVPTADLAGQKADEARRWFTREFEELECEVANPIGKVLLADLVLSVAKYAGERRFREQRAWAEQFAKNAAVLLAHKVIRVDIAKDSIAY